VVLVEISFADYRLQLDCESEVALRRAYGHDCARYIRARLADLGAAATLDEFRSLPGGCRELDGGRRGEFVLALPSSKRLVLAAAGGEGADGATAPLDWQRIDAIQALSITDDKDDLRERAPRRGGRGNR
jgi:toxin HigB-1